MDILGHMPHTVPYVITLIWTPMDSGFIVWAAHLLKPRAGFIVW